MAAAVVSLGAKSCAPCAPAQCTNHVHQHSRESCIAATAAAKHAHPFCDRAEAQHSSPPADAPRAEGPSSLAALPAPAPPSPPPATCGRAAGEWGRHGAGSTERRTARRRRSSVSLRRASTCAAMLRMEPSRRASSSPAHAGNSSCGPASSFSRSASADAQATHGRDRRTSLDSITSLHAQTRRTLRSSELDQEREKTLRVRRTSFP